MSLLVIEDIITGDRPFSNLQAENINASSGSCKFLCVATQTTSAHTYAACIFKAIHILFCCNTRPLMGTGLFQDLLCTAYKSPHRFCVLHPPHPPTKKKNKTREINKDTARHGAELPPDAARQDTQDLKKHSLISLEVMVFKVRSASCHKHPQ